MNKWIVILLIIIIFIGFGMYIGSNIVIEILEGFVDHIFDTISTSSK